MLTQYIYINEIDKLKINFQTFKTKFCTIILLSTGNIYIYVFMPRS